MKNRDISLIIIGLFSGAMIGGVLGKLLAWLLPSGVVKDFFFDKSNLSYWWVN